MKPATKIFTGWIPDNDCGDDVIGYRECRDDDQPVKGAHQVLWFRRHTNCRKVRVTVTVEDAK